MLCRVDYESAGARQTSPVHQLVSSLRYRRERSRKDVAARLLPVSSFAIDVEIRWLR
jgi:hypothetical protein